MQARRKGLLVSTSSGGSTNKSENAAETDLNETTSVADKSTTTVQGDDTKNGDQAMTNAENPSSESTSTILPTNASRKIRTKQ